LELAEIARVDGPSKVIQGHWFLSQSITSIRLSICK